MNFFPRCSITGVLLAGMSLAGTPEVVRARVSGEVLRRFAERADLPAYPSTSIANGNQGVVVAELVVSTQGRVDHVRILESPDELIRQSVMDTLLRWRFRTSNAPIGSRRIMLVGRFVFYFRLVGGKAIVVDAVREKLRKVHPDI